jgi:hypothetical protein
VRSAASSQPGNVISSRATTPNGAVVLDDHIFWASALTGHDRCRRLIQVLAAAAGATAGQALSDASRRHCQPCGFQRQPCCLPHTLRLAGITDEAGQHGQPDPGLPVVHWHSRQVLRHPGDPDALSSTPPHPPSLEPAPRNLHRQRTAKADGAPGLPGWLAEGSAIAVEVIEDGGYAIRLLTRRAGELHGGSARALMVPIEVAGPRNRPSSGHRAGQHDPYPGHISLGNRGAQRSAAGAGKSGRYMDDLVPGSVRAAPRLRVVWCGGTRQPL